MGAVSRWAVNRPWQAVIVWVVLLVAIAGGAAVFNLDPPIESAVIVLVGLCSWCWVGAWVIGRSVRIFHVVVGLGRLRADGWAARRGWAVADSPA